MKVVHNANYHKTKIKDMNLGNVTFTNLELCPLITLYANMGIICVGCTHFSFILQTIVFSSIHVYFFPPILTEISCQTDWSCIEEIFEVCTKI